MLIEKVVKKEQHFQGLIDKYKGRCVCTFKCVSWGNVAEPRQNIALCLGGLPQRAEGRLGGSVHIYER